ncbi:hypothetical protein D9M68_992120 [compost metagenome]
MLADALRRLLQHARHDFAQIRFIERLFQEIDRAFFHRRHGHRHVAVAGDEHDGQRGIAGDQLFLQFQAAHAGHAHVEDQHADLAGVVVFQERFAAGVGANAVAVGFQ